jgi:hypothetical protein
MNFGSAEQVSGLAELVAERKNKRPRMTGATRTKDIEEGALAAVSNEGLECGG